MRLSTAKKLFIFCFVYFIPMVTFTAFAEESPDIVEITSPESIGMDELQKYNAKIGQELIRAIDQKKLLVSEEVEIQLNQLAVNGFATLTNRKKDNSGQKFISNYKAFASKELLDLLINLVSTPEITPQSPLSILSLLRFGSSAHGEMINSGKIIGRAVDINYFAGNKINIENPEKALEAILLVTRNLPAYRFTLGLPRPGGGNRIDPLNDFFLPVQQLSQARKSPTGNIKGDLKEIKNDFARQKITEMVSLIKADILFLYPDATDHLHVKAVEPGKNQ